MKTLTFTASFKKDYRRLPQNIQKATEKQLQLLLDDFNHPSLNTKKMQGVKDVWEGRITRGYRFTFEIHADVYLLRRIGTHDLLRNP